MAIARAMVNDPALILADEPTGELDSTTGAALIATLRRLNVERGMTVVIVTHDPGVAGKTDRVVRLSDGHVRADVRPAQRSFADALRGDASLDVGHAGWLGSVLDRLWPGR